MNIDYDERFRQVPSDNYLIVRLLTQIGTGSLAFDKTWYWASNNGPSVQVHTCSLLAHI